MSNITTSTFLFHKNETYNGSFQQNVGNKEAPEITSSSLPCMPDLEKPIDAQRNTTALTMIYSPSLFVTVAAGRASSCLFSYLCCGINYSSKNEIVLASARRCHHHGDLIICLALNILP